MIEERLNSPSLVHLLRARSLEEANVVAMTHLIEGGETARSYADLDREARTVAARLAREVDFGDRVLLLYPPGPEFVAAFFGCLYRGAVAVPIFPPDPRRLERSLGRLVAIAADAKPRAILTVSAVSMMASAMGDLGPDLRDLPWLSSDTFDQADAATWAMPDVRAETVAFIQYTSGSTSTPKGVVLSHANLLHNSAAIFRAFGNGPHSRGVIWLPTYHDMGLIGGVLQPIYGGFPVTLMSPIDFLQRPFRWLQAISRTRATCSGGPNFAFEHCVRKISAEERRTLDLSSWELAFTGAEPVRASTVDAFAATFAECGFRREAFYPCYGLAEATLMVTGGRSGTGAQLRSISSASLARGRAERPSGPGDARVLVTAGTAIDATSVVIVDPDTRTPLADGAVGEIWVSGPSVARGYWNRPDETEATFRARLADGRGPFLRTGDLGCFDDGELVVTGRRKDLLIVRGRNVYPQDLELSVETSHHLVRAGCSAAFGIDVDGAEHVVVAAEISAAAGESEHAAVFDAIRTALVRDHEVAPRELLLLAPGAIPKTSSGKIQRSACRDGYLGENLRVVARSTAAPAVSSEVPDAQTGAARTLVAGHVARRLGIAPGALDVDAPLVQLGLDSLMSADLAADVEAQFGVTVRLRDLLDGMTLRSLFELVERGPDGLARTDDDGGTTLSFAQARLWILHRLDPSSAANNVALTVRLSGAIDVPALAESARALFARHAVLRATFREGDEGPMQELAVAPPFDLVRVDLTDCSPAEREQATSARIAADAGAPFDLARGPLLRLTLIERAPGESTLLVVVHHIAADGRSAIRLVEDLGAVYAARIAGSVPPPPPARSYATFARRERESVAETLERSLSFWRETLAGASPLVDLPTDAPRPARSSGKGGRARRPITADLWAALKRIARETQTTPFVVLHAALVVTLQRRARQSDLVIGTVTSTRAEAAFRDVVGDYTNFLPLRLEIAQNDTARTLIGRARTVALAAFEHAGCPYERIVEVAHASGSSGHLYNVALVDHGYATVRTELGPGVRGEIETVDNGTSEVDLSFEVFHREDGGITLDCRYASDVFDPHTGELLLAELERALAAFTRDLELPVRQIDLLSGESRHRQLVEWNDTAAPREDVCVHELFEAQVGRTPDAIAVSFGDTSITYAELEARANQLAHHLCDAGVGRGDLVGICLERSLELVVALFAVLKAGAAYVPLDPDYPAERLAYMREDARVRVLVTDRRCAGDVGGTPVILVDEHRVAIDARPTSRPTSGVTPDDLTYVIYTSGSTGRPKGAMNAHRAVANRIQWMQDAYRLDASDAVLQKTPFSFDVSVWEFFWPTAAGARLVVARPGGHRDTAYLVDVVKRSAITTLHFVPSMLEAMLEEEGFGSCTSIRRVICSGEALPRDLQDRYFRRQKAPLYNLYGPTEAAVDVTAWTCRDEPSSASVPIGRPISNVRVYVVDDTQQLLPIGARGELCIGGIAVGRGYLRRPELTAERFVADPFSDEPGARLYRTGDEVVLGKDGTIVYLGRLDEQVKLRGHRIELGEVRAALTSVPGVRDAAVIVQRATSGDRLVAYVVGEAPESATIEEHLQRFLPPQMIPSLFVPLAALPLTPSGKLDRRALPPPPAGQTARASDDGMELDPIEATALDIARELLGEPSFAPSDNFFAHGGHSLLATQFVARVRKALRVELPLATFFDGPTVAAVARYLRSCRSDAPLAPPPRKMPRNGEVPLSFAQERLWFLSQLAPDLTAYHVPRALRFRGALDIAVLERAFGELLARHEILRSTFPMVDGRPVQRVPPPQPISIPETDLRALPSEERETTAERLVREEGQKLFDLERGPMVRLRLLRMAEDDALLILTEHHLVHDGWTQGVLARDFLAIYEARLRGAEPRLPELPLQYADYTLWQRDWLAGEARERLVTYWRERLAGLPTLELPTDRPRPRVYSFRGAEQAFDVSPELAQKLRAFAKREGVTLFMVFLAAFDVLMGRYARQEDVPVGIQIANRRWEELENVIGMMINTIIHRADLSGNPSFRQLLKRVREASLRDYAHQDLPFEQVVSAVAPSRSLSVMPLAQVEFGFQDVPEPPLRLPGVEIEVVYRHNESTKNDLLIMIVPHAEQRVGTDDAAEDVGIAGFFEYSTDLFDHATITRMIGQYLRLLEAAADRPETSIWELPMIAEEERRRILDEWGNGPRLARAKASFAEMVTAQADRTPERLAVMSGEDVLTYRELERRSRALAHELRRRGVGAESRIVVCLERSARSLVAMLGVLRAGGVYVPVDPASPAKRLERILADCAPRAAISSRVLSPLFGDATEILDLDDLDLDLDRLAAPALPEAVHDAQAAYVIYTSGSTGVPNGVVVPHAALRSMVLATHEAVYRGLDELVVGISAPFHFDASLEQIAQLAFGATLVVFDDEARLDVERMLDVVIERRLSAVDLSPRVLRGVLAAARARGSELPARIVVGNEAVDAKLWQEAARLPDTRVLNGYGPTEATVEVTIAAVEGEHPVIGRPIANVRVYVLDASGESVPIGVPGELYIGGDQVARGYLARPELTAARFVPDPFSDRPGSRLYRTGDLGRWLPDGRLDFLGRADGQVKVRGFRVEIGEIERALLRIASVRDAVVVARKDGAGDVRLAAYVTPNETSADLQGEALRAELQTSLPDYMLPSAFVVLDVLPTTPNGKIARKALPEPESWGTQRAYVAPRNALEEQLASIFAAVLELPHVGIHDNFFESGGHSLLATQVVSRIRTVLMQETPVRTIFEAPTVAELALKISRSGSRAQAPIPRMARGEPLPASFAQSRLYFLDQLQPGSAAYNMPAALRLSGSLDVDALSESFRKLVARHESLRTTFCSIDGKPKQLVTEPPATVLEIVDVASDDELVALAQSDAETPFDLAKGPLVRARLLRRGPEEHVLLLCIHHIVSDGWSTGVLVRDLVRLYQARVRREPDGLVDLPIQYADYAAWQHDQLTGQTLARELAYWTAALAGAPASLTLPTDRPRPPIQSSAGALLRTRLPPSVADGVRLLAQRAGATPFMVLLSAFNVLLSRHAGQKDIVVGTPIANRTRRETEGVVGFFANTLALRADLHGQPSFLELLARVKKNALAAYAHQDVPFERVVDALAVPRDLSRSPVFQVMFVLDNTPEADIALPGLTLRPLDLEHRSAKFDLSLSVSADFLHASWEFSTDLFDCSSVERFAQRFERLLEGALARPDASVWELPLLAPDERALLERWSTTADLPTSPRPLADMIARQVERSPDRLAIVCGPERLTYRELDVQARAVASELRRLGVEAEARVMVLLERSARSLVAMLGVLRAGGVYVPLDTTTPKKRLEAILADGRPHAVITSRALAPIMPKGIGRVVVFEDLDRSAATSSELPYVHRDQAAYVIYTSGSTGTPNGVIVTHAALANMAVATHAALYADLDKLVVGISAAFHFDASLEQIAQLAFGATLVIFDDETRLDADRMLDVICEHGLTAVELTPKPLRRLLDTAKARGAKLPARVIVGSEAVDPTLWSDAARLEGTTVIDGYGPTETTVEVTTARVTGDRPIIGRPIAGVRVYVLDANGELVPVGVPGELFVGGVQVARGYLSRPELTAARFVPDPFSSRPGARLYTTGDLVRWLPDGNLEFLGRADGQIKIRGFRIEIGEIERGLTQLPNIREAVVVPRTSAGGDVRLAAYVTPRAGAGPLQADALRTELKATLPEYMLPSAFVMLDALPLTSNGKVARNALPEPESWGTQREYAPPRDAVEEQLASIFAEVLGLPRVGIHDGFFESGGHSLLAMQVVSRIRSELARDTPVRVLFEAPTIAELATRLGGSAAPTPIPRVSRRADLPASFAQSRLLFLDRLQPGSATYNMPVALRLSGVLDVDALSESFRKLVDRHESLRTTFRLVGGEAFQIIAEDVPANILDVTDVAGDEELLALTTEDAETPFDLMNGPLVRARLLRRGPEEHVLLLCIHHIVSDGWSTGILVRDLVRFYQARVRREPDGLADLPIQYADYAAWQRAQLDGERLGRELAYWTTALAGAPASLTLPTDRPRPPIQSSAGALLRTRLPPSIADGVRLLAQRAGATPFMVLLSAFNVLLSRHAGQKDIVVGTPIASRTRRETEGIIGFFANTLALRADLRGQPSFLELLARVKKNALAAYAHQDVPFERVVDALAVPRDLSRSPVFQVMFVLDNTPEADMSLQGLSVRPIELEHRTAKFDLSLSVSADFLHASWEFSTDLLDRSSVERFAQRFEVLLDAAVRSPETTIGDLELLPADERDSVLRLWNATSRSYTTPCLHALFEDQVARRPTAEAVRSGAASLTYAELNARSNRLAHGLRALGVGPEVLVGVCIERTIDLLVALLGVLKAGGAYVPVDPTYPAERLALLVEDACPVVVLVDEVSRVSFPDGVRTASIRSFELQPSHDPEPLASPQSLAYVIYTSGSTGRPKGVAIAHANASTMVAWAREVFSAEELQSVLWSTSVTFDLSVFEVFVTLAAGGRVVLVNNALELGDVPCDVSLVNTVPSILAEVLRSGKLPASVRTVNLAGEALPRSLVQRIAQENSSSIAVYNLYGPSEDTTYSTFARVDGPADDPPAIGRPIANTQAYVLDEAMRLVPTGTPGELYLGGAGLARGYVNRPALTAERWVPDPFGAPGGRLYRTGDLVRWRANGELEYLGRLDHQVKIRGFRIELGEIESALADHPAVDEVIVAVSSDARKEKRLAAHVMLRPGATTTTAELRAFLEPKLPGHMIPGAIAVVDVFPRTPNGKVDRKALAALELDAEHAPYAPPRNELEAALAQVFVEVLGVDRVGIDDDFFRLGGHSLLAMRAASRIQTVTGRELPLRALFESSSVAKLAVKLGGRAAHGAENGTRRSTPFRRPDWAPVTHQQARILRTAHEDVKTGIRNIPFAFELDHPLDPSLVVTALRRLLVRHPALTARFEGDGEDGRQLLRPVAEIDFATVDVGHLAPAAAEEEALRIIQREATRGIDVFRDPLLRARLILDSDVRCWFLYVVHHIVGDGVSVEILASDLKREYDQLTSQGEAVAPARPPEATYFQYAWQQHERRATPAHEADVRYWSELLQGASVVRLPRSVDAASPVKQTRSCIVDVTRTETAALRELARGAGASTFMVILSLLNVLLEHVTGQDDLVVGMPAMDRPSAHVETIGNFVSAIAVRTKLHGETHLEQLLAHVKRQLLDGAEHVAAWVGEGAQHVGFGLVPGYSPLFQVVASYARAKDQELRIGPARGRVLPEPPGLPKFDLTVMVYERDDVIEISLDYDASLFAEVVVASWGAELSRIVGRVTDAGPAAPALAVQELEAEGSLGQLVPRSAAAPRR